MLGIVTQKLDIVRNFCPLPPSPVLCAGVVVPSQLAAGLERQRRLYDQLLEKTRQLRRMQAVRQTVPLIRPGL